MQPDLLWLECHGGHKNLLKGSLSHLHLEDCSFIVNFIYFLDGAAFYGS